jgi:hypothetical protein
MDSDEHGVRIDLIVDRVESENNVETQLVINPLIKGRGYIR